MSRVLRNNEPPERRQCAQSSVYVDFASANNISQKGVPGSYVYNGISLESLEFLSKKNFFFFKKSTLAIIRISKVNLAHAPL